MRKKEDLPWMKQKNGWVCKKTTALLQNNSLGLFAIMQFQIIKVKLLLNKIKKDSKPLSYLP